MGRKLLPQCLYLKIGACAKTSFSTAKIFAVLTALRSLIASASIHFLFQLSSFFCHFVLPSILVSFGRRVCCHRLLRFAEHLLFLLLMNFLFLMVMIRFMISLFLL